MKLSFVVSCFNRPDLLGCCLYSLKGQTLPDFEVLVTDNAVDHRRSRNRAMVLGMNDPRFRYANPRTPGCYHSAEWALPQVTGEFVCFPSDDSYYVPVFAETMLEAAEERRWDLVYCDAVYSRGWFKGVDGGYRAVTVEPKLHHIDKTFFIVRRRSMIEWPNKIPNAPCWSDGYLVEALRNRGVRHGKVDEVLVVHN